MTKSERVDAAVLEENLEDLYENAPCGYVSTLPDGTFVKVNQTFLSWIGYPRQELLFDRRFQDLLTVAGKIYYETHYAPLLQMQGYANEIAFDVRRHDGTILPVLVNAVLQKDLSGTPLLIRTTIFNASDRREYERELLLARNRAEQAAQAKARMLSTLGHEIRSPLSAIIMAARALERTSLDPKQQRFVRILNSSSQSLLNLVEDILDYGKIEAGKVTLEEKLFDARVMVSDLLCQLEPKAEAKNLALELHVDDRLPTHLVGDPVKIGQILTNLVGNAIKFTEEGSVTLTLRVRELLAERVAIDFTVKDTGIGIAPDRLAYIFDDFTQASPEIATKFGGTGLGLAISQKLVQLHGSEIEVESTLGVGTTFAFTLHLKKGHAGE